MSYSSERLAAFDAMVASGMYGSTLNFGGTDYDCIAEGVDIEKLMTQAAWQPERASKFSIRLTDWNASGMTNRSTFNYRANPEAETTFPFEINGSVKVDPVEPIVWFSANLKK